MTTLGIWSCQWRELRPMSFGANTGGTSSQTKSNGGTVDDAEDVIGHTRGRGRGKGRDGAGAYEMVGMEVTNGSV